MPCPVQKAAKDAANPVTSTTAVNVVAFAAKTTRRCGVALRVARIWPVAYSEVITNTPEEFRKFVDAEIKAMGPVVKSAGLQPF